MNEAVAQGSGNPLRIWLVATLLVASTVTLAYPFASQWFEQRLQAETNAELARASQEAGPALRAEIRERAEAYNTALASGIPDPELPYAEQLRLSGPSATGADVIARLRVPAIGVDQSVRHTLDEPVLLAGLGHAEGSSLPVGGPTTHAVIGGHRGLAQAIGFTRLPEVRVGDLITVDVLGETLAYRVFQTAQLEPLEAAVHPIEPGRDLLTLITCTPLGVNSHRFVVTAERIELADVDAGETSGMPGFPWWAVVSGGALALIGTGTVLALRRRRHRA